MKVPGQLFFCCVSGIFFIGAETTSTYQHNGVDKNFCIPEGTVSLNITYNGTTDQTIKKILHFEGTFNLTNNADVTVNCSGSWAQVNILLPNTSLKVILLFAEKNRAYKGDMFLDDIVVLEDTSDKNGNGISKRDKDSVASTPILFESKVNKTSNCGQNGQIRYSSTQSHASFVFSNVRLHPFNDLDSQHQQRVPCYEELKLSSDNKHSEFLVPVILAISLVVVISLLVTGFLVHRKIEGMGYTSMD